MLTGLVTAAFGRHYEITLPDGRLVKGIPRGKKSPYACGDIVNMGTLHDNEASILGHQKRSSLLFRSDQWKQKIIAANVTQIVVVVATEPAFSEALISRALVAATHAGIHAAIILNKIDISAPLDAARARMANYAKLGYPVLELKRIRIGELNLHGLSPGEFRFLQRHEVDALRATARSAGADQAMTEE